jgi:cytochrome c oxidase subunit II
VKKTKQLFVGLALMLSGLGTLQAQECASRLMEGSVCLPKGFPVEPSPQGYALNLTPGQTQLSGDVYDLHMLILWICVFIGVGVFGTMFYSIYHHRKSKGHVAQQFHENTTVEIIWTVIPALILISMAIPATKTLMEMDDVQDSDMTVKVTGWQWKWEYEYLDSGIHFFSNLDEASNRARQLNSKINVNTIPHYLLRVDEPLVVPVNKKIRFVFTAADVLHSWWVPELGWKKDAIPGFINEAWTSVPKPGVYRGQCTELCGKDHGFMPVVVVALEQADYDNWKQGKLEELSKANDNADQGHDELVKKGGEIYAKNCATCHMEDGSGVPGAFPAIKGSAVVNGDINVQANLIINGKNAMPAFGKQLKAAELAQVITYTRNALGNSKGDEIQAKGIETILSGGKVEGGASAKTESKPVAASYKSEVSAKKTETAESKPAAKAEEIKSTAKAEDTKPSATPSWPVKSPKVNQAQVDEAKVDNPQFAQDKLYPQKRMTDKPVETASAKPAAKSAVGLDELVSKGAAVYEKSCQSCHQKEGTGMPPTFPALKASPVVTGSIDKQVELMLKGKGMMPAFGKTLSADEFAAVLAFTRNKLGNSVGDFKAPADIAKLQ